MSNVLSQRERLRKYVARFGSPLNIHNPRMLGENARLFQQVLARHKLNYRIFFARKPNKCLAYVREAKRIKVGVDVASLRELSESLRVGIQPADIVLTGAVKHSTLLALAVRHGVPVIIDSHDELLTLLWIARSQGVRQPIGIRVSGFRYRRRKLYSRFGYDIDELEEVFSLLENNRAYLDFRGFHFHLQGYIPEQRSRAVLQLLRVARRLAAKGIRTSFVDIGGGFLVRYLDGKDEWGRFNRALKRAIAGVSPAVTFRNDGLGYGALGGRLFGSAGYYPYYNELPKERFLDKVLSYRGARGERVSDALRRMDIELRLEPGRALLDQCGLTVARVAFRKLDQNGEWLVGLEMNRTQLLSSSADFLLDPKVVYLGKKYERGPVSCYFVGNYCLENDLILKRKIGLSQLPQIGDLVCFINTAGYMMHFFEAEGHRMGPATNAIVQHVAPLRLRTEV